MTDAAAFEATFTDWRLIKGRKVVQVVLEVPLELADRAYQALGGMPDPAGSVWVAVARLNTERQVMPDTGKQLLPNNELPAPTEARPARAYSERQVMPDTSGTTLHNELPASVPERPARAYSLPQRVGMTCTDPMYWRYLKQGGYIVEMSEENAAKAVRWICCVDSRSEIIPGSEAATAWDSHYSKFVAWRDAPELVP